MRLRVLVQCQCRSLTQGDAEHTMMVEVEQIRQLLGRSIRVTRIREPRFGVANFVKEGMNHCINGGQALRRCVLEQFRDEVNRIRISLAEDLDRD